MILSIFFLTEMWERYGFYVVQSLLALYLALHLNLDDQQTYTLVGSFTALTYISPIMGGWLADNYLGQKKAVLCGIGLLFFSYLILAWALNIQHLIAALALIALGTGLLKPNISALVGRQYPAGDPRRHSSFTIFYLGITLGIILGTTLPSQLQAHYGWPACFFSAALGLALAGVIFSYGWRVTKFAEYAVLEKNAYLNWSLALLIMLVSYGVFYVLLKLPLLAHTFFSLIILSAIALVLGIAGREAQNQRRKTQALLLLLIISVFFWAFYFQMFMVLTLFIARVVEPQFLGLQFTPPYYVAVQSAGMVVFGIFLSRLWTKIASKNIAYATAIKFCVALACMLLAYIVIFLATKFSGTALISPWPVLGAYLLISVAELLISPIGLSTVTHLAREKVVSTLMGVFFVSLGVGGFLAGQLSKLSSVPAASLPLLQVKKLYLHGFGFLVELLAGILVLAVLLCLLIRYLSKQINWEVVT